MTEPVPNSPSTDHAAGIERAQAGGPTMARVWALIACAGSGTRAATALPKQYQPLAGRAMVLHTLAAFVAVDRVARTLVLLAAGDGHFSQLAAPTPGRWVGVSCGGTTRAQTVSNGLLALPEHGAAERDWVLVHDAARCLITPREINRLIDACEADAVGGLLALPVPDTLKVAALDRVAATADRGVHWLAQTPQMFRLGALREALLQSGAQVTDESAAMEAMGVAPKLVNGSPSNFKVTYPEDFAIASALLRARARGQGKELNYDYP